MAEKIPPGSGITPPEEEEKQKKEIEFIEEPKPAPLPEIKKHPASGKN